MNKELNKAAQEFKTNMQKISDKSDVTISLIHDDGKETVISKPKSKKTHHEKTMDYLNNENPTMAETEEMIKEYNKQSEKIDKVLNETEEDSAPLNPKDKLNFTSQLNLACSTDDFRPEMQCVYFYNNYAYASDGHIMVRQSLDLHTILNPENLEGKSIHKDSFKQILSFKVAQAKEDCIVCNDGERKATFKYSNYGKAPAFDSAIPTGELIGPLYFGINPKFITIAGKVLHGSNNGVRMSFRGSDKCVILTTEEFPQSEQMVLIMPLLLQPTLF